MSVYSLIREWNGDSNRIGYNNIKDPSFGGMDAGVTELVVIQAA